MPLTVIWEVLRGIVNGREGLGGDQEISQPECVLLPQTLGLTCLSEPVTIHNWEKGLRTTEFVQLRIQKLLQINLKAETWRISDTKREKNQHLRKPSNLPTRVNPTNSHTCVHSEVRRR